MPKETGSLPKIKLQDLNAMKNEKLICLINESNCGRVAGNPICPKCGMDEKVAYPGELDLTAAQNKSRIIFRFNELEEQTSARSIELEKISERLDASLAECKIKQNAIDNLISQEHESKNQIKELSGANDVRSWFCDYISDEKKLLRGEVVITSTNFPRRFSLIIKIAFIIIVTSLMLFYVRAHAGENFEPVNIPVDTLIDSLGGCDKAISSSIDNKDAWAYAKNILVLVKRCEQKAVDSMVFYVVTGVLGLIFGILLVIDFIGSNRIKIDYSRISISRGYFGLLGEKIVLWSEVRGLSYGGNGEWYLVPWIGSGVKNGIFRFSIGAKCNFPGYTPNRGLALIKLMIYGQRKIV